MSAEAVPQPELTPPRPELSVVPGQESPDITEQVAAYVHAIDSDLVPQSVEQADEAVRMIRKENRSVQKAVASGESNVEPDVAESLNEIAEQGTSVWRLSETEAHDYWAIAHAKKPSELSETAMAYLGGGKSFAALKKEANARLNLDRALHDRELAERADKLAESMKTAGFDVDATKTRPAQQEAQKQPAATKRGDMTVDLSDTGIKVDANGRGHRDHGKFISKKQLEQIEANADLIRSDQQGTREAYETREAKRQTELDKKIEDKAKKLAFKRGFGSRALERVEGLKDELETEATQAVGEQGEDVRYRDDVIEMPEGFDAMVWSGLSTTEQRNAVNAWNEMSDEDRAAAFTKQPDFSKRVSDMDAETRAAYFANVKEAAELQADEPVTSLEQKSLRARVGRIFGKAGKKLAEVYTTVGNKIINPFDKELTDTQQKRRKVLLGVGIGAVAAYGLYARLHGMEHGSGGGSAAAGHEGTTPAHVPKFDKVKLHHGDNIWKIEESRHPHASEAHIKHLVERDLRANHLSWDEARHLADGQSVKITHKR